MSVFEGLGLYEQINRALYAQISLKLNPKVKELPHFFDKIQKRMLIKAFGQIEWQTYFEVNPIEPLNPKIKANIIARFDSMNDEEMNEMMLKQGIDDMNIWVSALWDFHLILSYYLNCTVEAYKHRHFRLVQTYYNFVREQIELRKLLIPNGLNVNPLEKYWKNLKVEQKRKLIIANKELEISKRLCPHCGARGKDIKKWSSLRYMCNVCGKTFRKPKNIKNTS